MGDRCNVTLHIKRSDLYDERYSDAIKFNLLDGEYKDVDEMVKRQDDAWGNPDRQVIILELEEVNYGGEEILSGLAEAGLLFVGSHTQGDSYSPSRFYSSGVLNGSVTYMEEGLSGGLVIYKYSEVSGEIAEEELTRVRLFLQGYHKAEQKLYASPIEQLIQATSEES